MRVLQHRSSEGGRTAGSFVHAGVLSAALLLCTTLAAAGKGKLKLVVVDADTAQPVACRMHLKNAAGKPILPRGLIKWRDHVVLDGSVTLSLPEGAYAFEIERGPEYGRVAAQFVLNGAADDEKRIELKRFVDMAGEGWYSGELHVHRPLEDVPLLMRAEDLHVAPVITWWNERNVWSRRRPPAELVVPFDGDRYYHVMGGEDERGGGALMYFNRRRPLDMAGAAREYPSALAFLKRAREDPGTWVDVEKPFWWDVPIWLASGQVDSVGLANNHMQRGGMLTNEAWGRARDVERLPDPWGNGQWTQEIYEHILDAGLRIPPSAGSASGVLDNPVGYNRMYVFTGGPLTYDGWWEAFRAGRVVVTNGPLVRPYVSGKLPGHVFKAAAGETVQLDLNMRISTRESGGYVEVVKNGQVERKLRLDEWGGARQLAPLMFDESGWFLVRVVTDVAHTYRFAATGPYYVEIGDEPRRISRRSAEFFRDWVRERSASLELEDPDERAEVLAEHRMALEFWQRQVERANAE